MVALPLFRRLRIRNHPTGPKMSTLQERQFLAAQLVLVARTRLSLCVTARAARLALVLMNRVFFFFFSLLPPSLLLVSLE